MNPLDIHEILEYLPHRYPILLVDRVYAFEAGKTLHAVKNVSINEPFFQGHFPHHPVMPGVLILEALAQAAAILTFKTMGTKPDDKSVYYFAGIDGARFKRPVSPGDVLNLHIEVLKQKSGLWKFKAVARVDGNIVTEGELMCTAKAL